MNLSSNKDKILVIDFGSQVTKLIARRIREYSVLSEVLTLKDLKKKISSTMLRELFYLEGLQPLQKVHFQKYQIKFFI